MNSEATNMTSEREKANGHEQRGGRPSGSSPLVAGTTSLKITSWVNALDGGTLTGTIARRGGEGTETVPIETSAALVTARAA
jgi:hypothetical protein